MSGMQDIQESLSELVQHKEMPQEPSRPQSLSARAGPSLTDANLFHTRTVHVPAMPYVTSLGSSLQTITSNAI